MMKYFKMVKINLKYSYYYDNITSIEKKFVLLPI